MIRKLQPKTILDLPGPSDDRPYIIHYDSDLPGFGLRVTRSGARSLVLNYRARGIERRITIDSVPANATVEQARERLSAARRKAEQMKSGAKYHGIDPMAERHEERRAATVAELADRYLQEHAPKKRTSTGDESIIDKYILPALRNRRVSDVRFEDIDGLHRKVTDAGAPIQANRVVALCSKMFSLAVKWRMRSDNPAKGVERNPEQRRQRYLTAEELQRLSVALSKRSRVSSANAVRLLLLTGARRGEVLSATWEQFDLGNGIWTKPSSHTKQKKEHRVPISAPARQLLATMLTAAKAAAKKRDAALDPRVFPGQGTGRPQADLKHFWAGVCKDAEIVDARIHDLRHTYASVLASSGQTLPVIGQLLGHTNPVTTSRYAHLMDDPLRRATERAAMIITGRKPRRRGQQTVTSDRNVIAMTRK